MLGRDSFWVHAAAPVEEAGVLALAFVYLAVLVLLFHRSATWRRRLGYLAPVGRMALTNYLTQSVLYLVLFTGVGFGLYGDVGPAWCVALARDHLCVANGVQRMVARALSLRSGGVGVANVDIWSVAANANTRVGSDRVDAEAAAPADARD